MAKFLLGLIVGILVVVFGAFLLVAAAGRIFASKPAVVPANAVLVLDLSGGIPESAPVELPIPFLQAQNTPTIRDLWTSLHAAASDNRVKAVLLRPQDLSVGWAKLEEIRKQIADFKRSGKPVYALLQGAGAREYYLSSIADRIYISPDDMLNVKGFRIEESFYRNTLDKIGIGVQVDHIGRYKDYGDTYTRTSMTPETREVLNSVLDQIYNDFCQTVADGRHKRPEDVRSLIDMGPFQANQAQAVGLVDNLAYEDQVFSDLKQKVGLKTLNKLSMKTYFRANPGKGDRIAFLVGEGDIIRGAGADNNLSSELIASGAFAKLVRSVREDSSVKGVIVRVDSPGGDAVASDEILHELKLLSSVKPLVVSMSDVAASGGYFMSMTGDPVLSYPDTITGSIGVIYVRPNWKGLRDKLGITSDSLSRGKLADLDSLNQPISDAGLQKLHDTIDSTYHSFVSKVASARHRNYDQIEPLAQGRVWMGAQAKQNGLVDDLGGLNEAVARIRKRAGLSAGGDTNLVVFPPKRSLLQALTDTPGQNVSAEDLLIRELRTQVPGIQGPSVLKGGFLEILPYTFTIE